MTHMTWREMLSITSFIVWTSLSYFPRASVPGSISQQQSTGDVKRSSHNHAFFVPRCLFTIQFSRAEFTSSRSTYHLLRTEKHHIRLFQKMLHVLGCSYLICGEFPGLISIVGLLSSPTSIASGQWWQTLGQPWVSRGVMQSQGTMASWWFMTISNEFRAAWTLLCCHGLVLMADVLAIHLPNENATRHCIAINSPASIEHRSAQSWPVLQTFYKQSRFLSLMMLQYIYIA